MTPADTTSSAGDPHALATEVASLQRELATLRKEMDNVKRERSLAAPDPSLQALHRQQAAWDLVLGLTPDVQLRRAREAAARRPSFEDVGARFLTQHAGKVWLFLLLLAALAVAFRDRLA